MSELYNRENAQTHIHMVALRLRNYLFPSVIWYHELTDDLEENRRQIAPLSDTIKFHVESCKPMSDGESLPQDFPFLDTFTKALPDYGMEFFVKILFLPRWVKKDLIKNRR